MKDGKSLHRCIGLSVLLLSLASCTNHSEAENSFPSMDFNVDPEVLSSPSVVDSSFLIQMPSDWHVVQGDSLDMIRQSLNSDTTAFLQVEVLTVHRSSLGSASVISKITNDSFQFDSLDHSFEEMLQSAGQTENISRNAFRLNGIDTIQYLIIRDDIVTFKLFASIAQSFYQIDYFIPATIYKNEISKLESSIGSITLF